MIDYRLYLVTDDPRRYKGNWIDNVAAAVEGGVTCVQYRDTESPRQVQYERILKLRDAIKGTPIIVNNDAELAAAVKAEGVHVGQSDMPVPEVRKIVGPNCEIGLSITEKIQISNLKFQIDALDANHQTLSTSLPDCLGIGPVFDARKTKVDASDAMGVAGLMEIIARIHGSPRSGSAPDGVGKGRSDSVATLQTVAIGGITLDNAAEVLSSGVGGLAIVSAFSKSPDPYSVARSFSQLFK